MSPYKIQIRYRDRTGDLSHSTYTYETDIPNLEIGDIVEVPPTWTSGGEPVLATVVALHSDYVGKVRLPVLRLVEKGRKKRYEK